MSLGETPCEGVRGGRGGIRGKIGRKVRVVKELGVYHGEKSRREF